MLESLVISEQGLPRFQNIKEIEVLERIRAGRGYNLQSQVREVMEESFKYYKKNRLLQSSVWWEHAQVSAEHTPV